MLCNSLQILVIPIFMCVTFFILSMKMNAILNILFITKSFVSGFNNDSSSFYLLDTQLNSIFYQVIIMINISKETIFLRLYQKWQIVNWEPYHSWMHKKEKVNTRKIMIETWMEFNFFLSLPFLIINQIC